jgi:hypothetical protein
MDVTDPEIEQIYLVKADGQYDVQNPVLCLSLRDPYQGYFYKLVVAVFYPDRLRRNHHLYEPTGKQLPFLLQ